MVNSRADAERILCLVMIESQAALDQADEIASVPGVDGIYIGQADLAVSLGLEPELRIQPGRHEAAIARILRACDRAGIAAGLSGDPAAMADAGFRIITAGSDQGFVSSGLKDLLRRREAASGRNTTKGGE
jgi:4-hydroxy-2-oxoheptanedioate aldolase